MKADYWPEEIKALVAAMSQILDDMRKDGTSVCLATKAQARIAYEPFADPEEIDFIMPIEEARRILEELP
jgi:hypothetical protein